ncbi:hypothetical protein L246_22275 [Salmonella enterica subsp. enterica serovar Worthington str. BCH-5715]|nr:hypothetical protein L246_22275 [Salmonella enterica subsp. enterica serovar Worthington str. BCH-5715]
MASSACAGVADTTSAMILPVAGLVTEKFVPFPA